MVNKHSHDVAETEIHGNTITVIIDLEEAFEQKHGSHHHHDPGTLIIYRIRINDAYFEVRHRHISGAQLLELAGKDPKHFTLHQRIKHNGGVEFVGVGLDEKVDLGTFGVERFKTETKVYCFSVNRKEYRTTEETLTVYQILVDYAHVDPKDKTLAVKTDGGFKEYKDLNEVVSLDNCPAFVLFDNTPTTVS